MIRITAALITALCLVGCGEKNQQPIGATNDVDTDDVKIAASTADTASVKKKPNIILILADDMGYGDLGSYNHDSKMQTPNIDSLAVNGVRFTTAHSPSSVCTPTRYGVLTGEYSWRTWLKRGVLNGYGRSLIAKDKITIAKWLQGLGYSTAAIGKWHLGFGSEAADYSKKADIRPTTLGFDEFFGIPASLDMPPYAFVHNGLYVQAPTEKVEDRWAGMELDQFPYWRGGPIAPDFDFTQVEPTITNKAVAFVESQKGSDKPYFLYMPFPAPHTPIVPTDAFAGSSQAGLYGDFVAQVDASVGRVLKAVEQNGDKEDTIILFASDNGAITFRYLDQLGHATNGGLRGMKSQVYEGGHRVPLLVSWPGHFKHAVSDRFVSLVDFFATLAEVLGESVPKAAGPDSYSFADVLMGKEGSNSQPRRTQIIAHSAQGRFTIRSGDWKLILGNDAGGFEIDRFINGGKPKKYADGVAVPRADWRLYNLANDLSEQKNVADANPQVVESLYQQLRKTQGNDAISTR
jgi:arylsulfatase A